VQIGVVFHKPFVLFGFLAACTSRLGLTTGVLILPQRSRGPRGKAGGYVREAGRDPARFGIEDHIEAIRRFQEAVAGLV
jgi:hypothetical protein